MENTDVIPDNSMIGRHVGAYKLEHEIGRGGMGAVYRASRIDGEFDQTVAIKLIKRGMDTDAILDRFRRERQILATLNHPNIGYFLGGGSTEDGLPYFVMEYIAGDSLYRHCDRQQLTIRKRLELFRQVCWAVAAAHQVRIVHRDIKPSNIVITAENKAKLLDFGIAKILDPDMLTTGAEPTATHMHMMTPQYASPEQASGEPVEPASDIYSLGVILYELVTGHRPYTISRNDPRGVPAAIRSEIPANPSEVLASETALLPIDGMLPTVENLCQARSSTVDKLRNTISGDLERIIIKALRKDPHERYANATAFADDITNFLEGRPVNAEQLLTMRSIGIPALAKRSIAILPFAVLGGDRAGDDFLGVGLADALISRMSGVPRLIVRPTTSVLGFVDTTSEIAAAKLGVDFVLEGSVRFAGDRLRVSVQLYNAEKRDAEWAKAFDHSIGDVLELEDLIAEEVSAAILPHLSSDERVKLGRRGTDNAAAYEAYMRGRYFWSRFSGEGLAKAVDEFLRAVELDPNYTLPYIGLADYYTWAAIFGELPSLEAFPKAQAAAQKALEIDPTLGKAYAALAFTVFLYQWNWDEAEMLVKQAIELDPNYGPAHEFYSNYLISQGRTDEGLREIRIAEQLDPGSPRAVLMTAWTLYQARRYSEALIKARSAYDMQPDLPQSMLHLGNILIATGEYDEAVRLLRLSAEAWSFSGLPRYLLAFARAGQGDLAAVDRIIAKLHETERNAHMKPYFIALAYVAAGKFDKAFEYLNRAAEERNEWLMWFATEPKLDPIRTDPRYLEILLLTNNPLAARTATADAPTTDSGERSVAVLPFRVLTSNENTPTGEQYLGIGIADSVTMRLSNVRKFTVRPTSAVLSFQGEITDPMVIGERLNVDFVVDGILRTIGDKIRVTAQLLNVSEGSTQWSASFSERFGDVLELEDSIAEQVSRNLLSKLSGDQRQAVTKRGTNSAEAHDAYMKGRFYWNQFTPDSFPRSLEMFRRAAKLDPNYALALVGIADYFTWATIYGIVPPTESLPQIYEHTTRALKIDPQLAEAHAALGLYHSNNQAWQAAEEHYRRAVELGPNYPLAHEWLSAILVGTGRFEEGLKEAIRAEELDPVQLRPKVLTTWTLYQIGDLTAALAKARDLEKLDPLFMQSHMQLANILSETGDHEEAAYHSEKAFEIEPQSPLPLYVAAHALVRAGRGTEAEQLVIEWADRSGELYVPPYFLAMAFTALGDHDAAFYHFEQARIERTPWMMWFCTEPKIAILRDDQRYLDIVRAMNGPILPPT